MQADRHGNPETGAGGVRRAGSNHRPSLCCVSWSLTAAKEWVCRRSVMVMAPATAPNYLTTSEHPTERHPGRGTGKAGFLLRNVDPAVADELSRRWLAPGHKSCVRPVDAIVTGKAYFS